MGRYKPSMLQNANVLQPMSELGKTGLISNKVKFSCIRFLCLLYGKDCVSLNKLCCEKSQRDILGKKLPPTEDIFILHMMRACYQLMVWIQAMQAMQNIPNATDYGYVKDSNTMLSPKLVHRPPIWLVDNVKEDFEHQLLHRYNFVLNLLEM